MSFLLLKPGVDRAEIKHDDKTAFLVFHSAVPSRAEWTSIGEAINNIAASKEFHCIPSKADSIKGDFVSSPKIVVVAFDAYWSQEYNEWRCYNGRRSSKIRKRPGLASFVWDLLCGRAVGNTAGKREFTSLFCEALKGTRQGTEPTLEESGGRVGNLQDVGDFPSAAAEPGPSWDGAGFGEMVGGER